MVEEVLVEQIQTVAQEVRDLEGPIALLMLVAPDIQTEDRWNIVVSAKGFDDKAPAAATNELTRILRKILDKSLWPKISRATVLRTDDQFVLAMNKAFRSEERVVTLQACNISGFDIPHALLFESARVAA